MHGLCRNILTITPDASRSASSPIPKSCEAAIKGAELKEQPTAEAKKLSEKAWKKALEMAEAYKNKREK
ncbi:hypothetical protein [Hydrogenimonas sp.]